MPQPVKSNTAIINLPAGKLVYVVASTQSNGSHSASIVDSAGTTVFKAAGNTSGPFTVIGSGTFTTTGNGTFTVNLDPGSAYMSSENTISLNGRDYLQQYTFVTNDGGWPAGDDDFNDLCVQIVCFGNAG